MTFTEQATEEEVRRKEWIAGLRSVADFYEAHPDLIPRSGILKADYTTTDEKSRAVAYAKALGSCDKEFTDQFFKVASKEGRFGPHKVAYCAYRESVCTRTVTVVETEVEVPDPDALAKVPMVKQTVTEEVVEWECSPLLGEAS